MNKSTAHDYWRKRMETSSLSAVGFRSFHSNANAVKYAVVCSAFRGVLDRMKISKNASFLDAGAGIGMIAQSLYDVGYRNLTLIDISADALNRVMLPVPKVVTTLETATQHMRKRYNSVYCFDVLYHLTDTVALATAINNLCALSERYVFLHGYFPRFFPLWIVPHARFWTLRKYDRIFAENGFRRIAVEPTFFMMLRLPFYRLFGWFPNFCYAIDRALLRAATILGISGASSHFIVVYECSQTA